MKWYNYAKSNEEVKNIFLKYNTPIFLINSTNLIINPILKDYNFAKIYDTTQAFQRISQFLTNELAHSMQGDVPVGGNEVIGRSKGFDEYSFRNAKKKPKRF